MDAGVEQGFALVLVPRQDVLRRSSRGLPLLGHVVDRFKLHC